MDQKRDFKTQDSIRQANTFRAGQMYERDGRQRIVAHHDRDRLAWNSKP